MNRVVWIAIFLLLLLDSMTVVSQDYVVGGDSDYAPFTFIDKTGMANGLEVDVLKTIAEDQNITLSFQLGRWEAAIPQLLSGKTDILVGILYSEERSKYLDFSIPLHTEYYSIFIHKDLPLEDLAALYDYQVVVLSEDVSIESYLKPMGLYQSPKIAQSLPEALSMIELGLADYVLAPNLLGLHVIERNSYKNIQIKGPSILPSMYCFAVRKGDARLLKTLNEGILELRQKGELIKIQERWKVYEKEDFKYKRTIRIILLVFVLVLIVLIMVIAWIRLLRMQIKRKTEHLRIKNLELQRSEEKFRVITENSSDIIWHLDANFLVTYISPADERVRGYKKEEVLGQSLFSILKPEGIELLKDANRKRLFDLSQGRRSAPAIYELEERCKDGRWVWIEATAVASYDADGRLSGYHGVSRDITERKKAEQLLKQREEQLSRLNATKDRLFSIIGHDLRSPFHAIMGLSELMMEQPGKFEHHVEYLSMIHTSAKNTLILLDNLLNWARAQTGNNVFNPEPLPLSACIREVIEESNSMARIKNISISFHPTSDIYLSADQNMLYTILRNLLSNAIKYSHANATIHVSVNPKDAFVEISITDQGVGMSEEAQANLFKTDSVVSTAGTANEKGSGLGLLLCKEFVEQHGGSIWVSSSKGVGSTFIFTLPLV